MNSKQSGSAWVPEIQSNKDVNNGEALDNLYLMY